MKSVIALVLLACVAVAVEGKCFKDSAKESFKDDMKRIFGPVGEACQKEGAEDVKKCAKDKIKAAFQECKKDSTSKKQAFVCVCNKVGATPPTEEEMSFDTVKGKIMEHVEDDKKDAVSGAFDACKSEEDFMCCAMKSLSEGDCPELKPFLDHWKKEHEDA